MSNGVQLGLQGTRTALEFGNCSNLERFNVDKIPLVHPFFWEVHITVIESKIPVVILTFNLHNVTHGAALATAESHVYTVLSLTGIPIIERLTERGFHANSSPTGNEMCTLAY